MENIDQHHNHFGDPLIIYLDVDRSLPEEVGIVVIIIKILIKILIKIPHLGVERSLPMPLVYSRKSWVISAHTV